MRTRVQQTMVLAVGAFLLLAGWHFARIPELPPRPRPGADMSTIKQDLFVFARAERAFYASAGHYAAMDELRDRGLLSLPPQTRWPYEYYVMVPGPKEFAVIAMAEGPLGGRPLALAIDEDMNMHELHPRDLPGGNRHRPQIRMWRT